jgi:hypothetical protein
MKTNHRRLVLLAAAAILVALTWWRAHPDAPTPPGMAPEPPESPATVIRKSEPVRLSTARPPPLLARADAGEGALSARFAWGSGKDQLGRDRPTEGNPEGPMSFAVDKKGRLAILDQVNGRILWPQTGAEMKLPVRVPQDLAMGNDGTIAVLDRLGDRSVALLGPDGTPKGELPLSGKGLKESGGVTGVFIDGSDVYVEREHGQLIRVGSTDGQPDVSRPEIPGRPTRDGKAYVLAMIIDRGTGRLLLAVNDRQTGQHRFTREIDVEEPVTAIVGLDSDLSGVLYLGVWATGAVPGLLLCIDPTQGQLLGQARFPLSDIPEESFRSLVALDSGGVMVAVRTENGVAYEQVECR